MPERRRPRGPGMENVTVSLPQSIIDLIDDEIAVNKTLSIGKLPTSRSAMIRQLVQGSFNDRSERISTVQKKQNLAVRVRDISR